MKIRSMFASGVLALAVAGGSGATAGAAAATPRPVPKATGSVALAIPRHAPTEYTSFTAFAGPGRYHGSVDYANFAYTIPKWMPSAGLPVMVKVHVGGPGYKHDTYASGVVLPRHHVLFRYYQITSGNILVK